MQIYPNLPGDALKRLLQGAVAGCLATLIIGFTWGGWTLGTTAKQMADKSASTAVIAALAPICVDKFQHATDATDTLVALKKINSWEQSSFVEKGGWATMPGSTSADSEVARACANALSSLK
jgi:hypothetical protein